MNKAVEKVLWGLWVALLVGPWLAWLAGGALGLWWGPPSKIVGALVFLGWMLTVVAFLALCAGVLWLFRAATGRLPPKEPGPDRTGGLRNE
jgi:cation transporter-like permease